MPNWCINELEIIAPSEILLNVVLHYIGSEDTAFDFNKILPILGDYGDDVSSINLCEKYWGTKWNASDITIYENMVFFDTLWTPPKPVIQQLADMFGDVVFIHTYREDNCAFAGRDVYVHSKLVQSMSKNEERAELDRQLEEMDVIVDDDIA